MKNFFNIKLFKRGTWVVAVGLLFFLVGCANDEFTPREEKLGLYEFTDPGAGTYTVKVAESVTGSWSITGVSGTWITVAKVDDTQLRIQLTAHTGNAHRRAQITISVPANSTSSAKIQTFTVTQSGTQIVLTDERLTEMMGAINVNNRLRLHSGVTYILSGLVFVSAEDTLAIPAGTLFKGRDVPAPGSALIIARGGHILAEGTAAAPIIFTYEGDANPRMSPAPPTRRGRWGGVIILGRAGLNSTPGETAIEGIPTQEERGRYGVASGSTAVNNDNSGVFRYVSIRHAGTEIGNGNEINGLTLGGVGSGTRLEYIEIIGCKDDGVEFFGGTAHVKYLISAYNQDDGIDYDEGFRGSVQFAIVHQDPATGGGDRCFELDGGTIPEDGMPYATPLFSNVTVLPNSNARAFTLRDNAGGHFYNVLVKGRGTRGVDIEYTTSTADSWAQFVADRLTFHSVVFDLAASVTAASVFSVAVAEGVTPPSNAATTISNKNMGRNIVLASISFPGMPNDYTSLKPTMAPGTPMAPSSALLANYPNNGFVAANYVGAVSPTATPWYEGWSMYHSTVLPLAD